MKRIILTGITCLSAMFSFAQTWNTFTTTYGNIQLGPADANWGHIYTDRAKFLFNKDIYTATGGYNSASGIGLSLKTNGATRMFIDPTTGNVGIGTTAPLGKLHVAGDVFIPSDYRLKFGAENPTDAVFTMYKASCCAGTFMDFVGNVYFRRFTSAGNQGAVLGLQKDGTVTIGVAERYDGTAVNTQGFKFMVNGGILCEQVKVIADVPNSDHVFKTDYKLMPLEELKSYVNENKHLPEIPSAKEFAENGYSLGKMDDLLLRKVEELTLYIIQLQEQVKQQQTVIDEMKQK
jgi:hypothetical protein